MFPIKLAGQYKLQGDDWRIFVVLYNYILFGGIYDNNLLVKIVNGNGKYNMQKQIPYKGAKPMYLVDDIDNKEILREIVIETCKDLPSKKR